MRHPKSLFRKAFFVWLIISGILLLVMLIGKISMQEFLEGFGIVSIFSVAGMIAIRRYGGF